MFLSHPRTSPSIAVHRRSSSSRSSCRCLRRKLTGRELDDVAILAEYKFWLFKIKQVVDVEHVVVTLTTIIALKANACWLIW